MNHWQFCTALFLCLIAVGQGQTRVPAMNFDKRATEIEGQRFPTAPFPAEINRNFMNQRFATPEVKTTMSRFDGRLSRLDGRESSWQERRFPVRAFAPAADASPRNFPMHRQAEAVPRIGNLERIRQNTLAARYSTEQAKPYGGIPPLFSTGEAPMSLADINRLNFSRGHSDEPGLPVQDAGGRP